MAQSQHLPTFNPPRTQYELKINDEPVTGVHMFKGIRYYFTKNGIFVDDNSK